MDNGLRIKLIYEDYDLLELDVSVSNGEFAGKGAFYVGIDNLSMLREAICGFPRSSTMLASSSSEKWTLNQRVVASGLASHAWGSQDDRTL